MASEPADAPRMALAVRSGGTRGTQQQAVPSTALPPPDGGGGGSRGAGDAASPSLLGAHGLVVELAEKQVEPLPSESAVCRCLVRAGVINPNLRHRRREIWKRWERGLPMELRQFDIVHGFLLRDGTPAKALTGLDDIEAIVAGATRHQLQSAGANPRRTVAPRSTGQFSASVPPWAASPARMATTSSVMSMATGHHVMQRPQPTHPEVSNWSIQVASLWVIHCRCWDFPDALSI